jgi:hypothetical protein
MYDGLAVRRAKAFFVLKEQSSHNFRVDPATDSRLSLRERMLLRSKSRLTLSRSERNRDVIPRLVLSDGLQVRRTSFITALERTTTIGFRSNVAGISRRFLRDSQPMELDLSYLIISRYALASGLSLISWPNRTLARSGSSNRVPLGSLPKRTTRAAVCRKGRADTSSGCSCTKE